MLGFSPAERLHWASHMMIANLLVLALMWGCLVEYAATAVVYWRDRHGARGAWKWATEAGADERPADRQREPPLALRTRRAAPGGRGSEERRVGSERVRQCGSG